MIKQILLTTDFSIASENAIRCALKTFENLNCHFTLFNCSEENSKEKSEFYLNKFREDLEWNCSPSHTFSSLFYSKPAEDAISELHEKFAFDIVVVGTTGLGNNQYFGKFAQKVYSYFNTACLFIPHHSVVQSVKTAQIIIEGSENLNINKLVNLRNHLEILNIKASILLVTKDIEEQKTIEDTILKDIRHLFGVVSTQINICHNYLEGICECLWSSKPDIFVFLLKEKLQNSFYKRAMNQPISDFHSAPILNIPSLQWSDRTSTVRENKQQQYAF